MTTRYVDAQMAFQGPRKVWAAGTASAVAAGDEWYTTIAGAIAAAATGDTLKVATGTYDLPASLAWTGLIAATGAVRYEYTPPDPLVSPLDAYCVVPAGFCVRFQNGEVAAAMGVEGSLVLDRVTTAVSGKVFNRGACVAIGSVKHPIRRDDTGAFEQYPAYFDEGRWPSQFPVSHYRNAAVLEAPAKYRDESGETLKRWVPVAEFRYLSKDGAAGESSAGSVNVATQMMTFFTKPGLAAHPDMKVVTRDRDYQIVGTSRPTGPGQDLRLTVTEGTGMPWGE